MELQSSRDVRRVLLPAHRDQAEVGKTLKRGVWDSPGNFSKALRKSEHHLFVGHFSELKLILVTSLIGIATCSAFFYRALQSLVIKFSKAVNCFIFPCVFQASRGQCHAQTSDLCHAKKSVTKPVKLLSIYCFFKVQKWKAWENSKYNDKRNMQWKQYIFLALVSPSVLEGDS